MNAPKGMCSLMNWRKEVLLKLYQEILDFWHKNGEIDEVEPQHEMLKSEDQIMLSNILEKSMDEEIISGTSGSYKSWNSMEELELQIGKSTIKGVPK